MSFNNFIKTIRTVPQIWKFGVAAILLLSGNQLSAHSPQQAFDSIELLVEKNYLTYEAKTREYIAQLYQIANNSPDSIKLIPRCLHMESLLSYGQGLSDTSLNTTIKDRIEKTSRHLYPFQHALLIYSSGLCSDLTGDYAEAFSSALQALEYFKQLNDTSFIGKTLNLLGSICGHIKLFNMADDYYKEAEKWITPYSQDYFRVKPNQCVLFFWEGESTKARDSLEKFLPKLEVYGDSGLLAMCYVNLATFCIYTSELEDSYAYCKKAEETLKAIDNDKFYALLNQNIGVLSALFQDYDNGIKYLNLAKKTAEQKGNFDQLSSIYSSISYTYALQRQYDSAYFYSKKFEELSLKQLDNLKAVEAYQAYVSAFLEASENQLTIAEQEIALKNKQVIVLVMVSVSIILLATVLALLFRQERKKKERENRQLAERLEHEKKIQQLETEKQNEIIAAKAREVTSFSLQLSNKNKVLQDILDVADRLPSNSKEVASIHKKINSIIKKNFNVDNDWTNFKLYFDQVHPSFFERLKVYCPDLTEDNLRMCSYFKIGMSTKQIAQIFNVAANSVTVHRHRLKKKLQLTEEDSLDDFLRSF